MRTCRPHCSHLRAATNGETKRETRVLRQNARKRSITSRARAILAFPPQTDGEKNGGESGSCACATGLKYCDRGTAVNIGFGDKASRSQAWGSACNCFESKDQNEERTAGGSSTYNSSPDDLYLDDQESLEGSGRSGNEGRDDLESSGSGLGPDDEDGDDDHDFDNNNRIEPPRPVEPKTPYPVDEPSVKTKEQTFVENVNRPDKEVDVSKPVDADDHSKDTDYNNEVYMNPKHEDRASSFFAQPGILAAVIGGAVVGLLCAILVVMFIVYRMRKKDEGSYALDEPRRSPAAQAFPKPGAPHHNREFYA